MRVTVWVNSWQFQCCGDDFAVGDTIAWQLVGSSGEVDSDLGLHARAPVGLLPVLDHLTGDEAFPTGVVVGAGSLRVFVSGDDQSAHGGTAERWVGRLREDHHIGVPPEAPVTEAVVRRITLCRHGFHGASGAGSRVPNPGSDTTEDVEQAPRWPTDPLHGRYFAGLLVDLDVADEWTRPPSLR